MAQTQEQSPDQAPSEQETIVVTGLRHSIQTSQEIKQNAEVIVDSISAVDISALPDRSVTEALQRISGVAIDHLFAPSDTNRFSAEGSGVTVRGLTQVRSELNGRDVFSARNTRGLSFEDVPAEYYIPATATASLELLRAHGVQMRALTAPVKGVEVFTITSNTARPAGNSIDMGTHGVRTIDGTWAASDTVVPAGSFAVPMNQPLARLAFYLIAPTSDDGLVFWNYLDDMLGADVKTFPIARKK